MILDLINMKIRETYNHVSILKQGLKLLKHLPVEKQLEFAPPSTNWNS